MYVDKLHTLSIVVVLKYAGFDRKLFFEGESVKLRSEVLVQQARCLVMMTA